MIGIYKLISPSGKVYIGQSWNIEHRLYEYENLKCKHQPKLLASLLKHGFKNHQFNVLHKCRKNVTQLWLDKLEIKHIKNHKLVGHQMLNIKDGGSRGKHSNETKLKISKLMKGRTLTKAHKLKLSKLNSGENNPFYGKTHSKKIMKDKKAKTLRGFSFIEK